MKRYLVLVLIVFTLLLHIKTAVCPRERCVGCQFGTGGGFYL